MHSLLVMPQFARRLAKKILQEADYEMVVMPMVKRRVFDCNLSHLSSFHSVQQITLRRSNNREKRIHCQASCLQVGKLLECS